MGEWSLGTRLVGVVRRNQNHDIIITCASWKMAEGSQFVPVWASRTDENLYICRHYSISTRTLTDTSSYSSRGEDLWLTRAVADSLLWRWTLWGGWWSVWFQIGERRLNTITEAAEVQHTSHHDLGKVTARLREDNERGGGEGGLEVKAFVCVPEVVSLNASLPGSIWCRRVGD